MKLTEAQAWETMARFFEMSIHEQGPRLGDICGVIENLYYARLIDYPTAYFISCKMDRLAPSKIEALGYWWPRNANGMKKRAKFCWKQSAFLGGRSHA